MNLTEEVKKQITDILDSKEFMSDLYEGLDDKKRDELGQFYTPGKICIQMIEKFSWDTLEGKTLMDPTCGSGNLLIACLIAGADLDKLYGNEYDAIAVELCKKRLLRAAEKLNLDLTKFRDWQIHQGNALHEFALCEFMPDYEHYYFEETVRSDARQNRLDNLKEVELEGYNTIKIYEHDCKLYKNKEFIEAYPESVKEHKDRMKRLIEQATNKPYASGNDQADLFNL